MRVVVRVVATVVHRCVQLLLWQNKYCTFATGNQFQAFFNLLTQHIRFTRVFLIVSHGFQGSHAFELPYAKIAKFAEELKSVNQRTLETQ
jgi:hypothetical protein